MVRVTEDEHAAIVKAADGAKLSAYVRECALTGIAARAPVEPPFMDSKIHNAGGPVFQVEVAEGKLPRLFFDKTDDYDNRVVDRSLSMTVEAVETTPNEDPISLWQSNLNYWYRDTAGRKEMLEELGKGLVVRMEALPMDQRAAFLAQELG